MSTVLSLFGRGCPPAIVRRVRTVVINAVNRMIRRGLTAHILKEGRVVPSPSGADCDASPCVTRRILCARAAGSINQVAPRGILGRHWPALAVLCERSLGTLTDEATARLRIAVTQGHRPDGFGVTTVANANPEPRGANFSPIRRDQSAEALTSKIQRFLPTGHFATLTQN